MNDLKNKKKDESIWDQIATLKSLLKTDGKNME